MSLSDPNTITKNLALAAFFSLMNPLDLAKSRLQSMPELIARGNLKREYANPIDCLKNVKRQEGLKALWKGNGLGLIRFFPNEQINVIIKRSVQSLFTPSISLNVAAGTVAGLGACAILYPMDTLRLLLTNQTSNKTSLKSSSSLRSCLKGRGAMSLYQGFSSSLLGIALYRGSFYGCYDSLKIKSTCFSEKWAAAYLSGLIATFFTYPLDTIRKRKIAANSNINTWKYFKQILQKEGSKAFFRGGSIIFLQSLSASLVLIAFDSDKVENNCA